MKRLLPRLLLVAVFSASWTLAEAQAVARGGGGGGSSSSGSSSGSSSSSGGGGGSTTSSTSSSGGGSSYSPPPAPTHSYAPPRTPSHSGGSNSGGSSSASGGGSRTPGSSAGAAGRRVDGGSTNSATAPTYARPDGSNGYNGAYAIPRQRNAGGGRPPVYIYSPYYSLYPWGFGFFGYGYGLNYFYDPFYSGGLGYPGYGSPYGYGYPGGYGYYGSGGYDPGVDNTPTYESNEPARERDQDGPTGELRVKVKPREAKVIVDGQVMGVVDDFDGMFQKLSLTEGHHRISLQLDGYETLTFDVVIMAGQTVNYKGELHKLADVLKR
jgi:PEGA domain